jgi:hypothetical protein
MPLEDNDFKKFRGTGPLSSEEDNNILKFCRSGPPATERKQFSKIP